MENVKKGQVNNVRYCVGIRGNNLMTNLSQSIASCNITNIGYNDYDHEGIHCLCILPEKHSKN